LGTFRLCPKKYRNRYILRLARKRRATPLRFGSAFHKGLELRAGVFGQDTETILGSVLADYDNCPEWADPAELAVERETLRQLLAGHFWRYSQDDLQYQAVELTFEIPLVDPATGKKSRRFRLGGKIDAIVAILPDGRLAVLEYKTAGEDSRCLPSTRRRPPPPSRRSPSPSRSAAPCPASTRPPGALTASGGTSTPPFRRRCSTPYPHTARLSLSRRG
jgi:hypothetical protein